MAELIVRISPDGTELETEVDGMVGSGCVEKTRGFLESIGETLEQKKKDAFYQEEPVLIEEKF